MQLWKTISEGADVKSAAEGLDHWGDPWDPTKIQQTPEGLEIKT